MFPGGDGLALAMLVAVVPLAPFGIAAGRRDLLVPWILAVGFAAGMLSSALPYTLELEALRRLPVGVFGVLMSLEPAVAALAGLRDPGPGPGRARGGGDRAGGAGLGGRGTRGDLAPRDASWLAIPWPPVGRVSGRYDWKVGPQCR